MYQVLINGEWKLAVDGEVLAGLLWYELADGSTGSTIFWRLL